MVLLEKENYYKLAELLKKVTINNLFARSVIEHHIAGKVFADNNENPAVGYVVHPYGISLLFGDCLNIEFNKSLYNYSMNIDRVRDKHEWMQAAPECWDKVLSEMFAGYLIKSYDNVVYIEKGIIELNTRVNFKFNSESYLKFKANNPFRDVNVVRTDRQTFRNMKGSVIPSLFWDNENDFLEKGVGFSLFHENKLASTAYSAFVIDNKLEIGIETVEGFRGRGFAKRTCMALIDYCLENNFEPVWSCKLENFRSYNLAQILGFEPIKEIPFYRLSK